MPDNRKYERKEFQVPLESICYRDEHGKRHLIRVTDISLGGAKLLYSRRVDLKNRQKIILEFPPDDNMPKSIQETDTINVDCEVRWVGGDPEKPEKDIAGVQFLSVSPDMGRKIEYLLKI